MSAIGALLSACGGGDASSGDARLTQAAPLASAATILQLDPGTLSEQDAQQFAQPAFHMAPVLMAPPTDIADATEPTAVVHEQTVPAEFRNLASRQLTVQAMQAHRVAQAQRLEAGAALAPLATGGTISTYTPQQIRAAYGLPALPAAGARLTAAQAAQLGAGQTIYIVDAHHNPNVAAELAAFNQKFGLPACTVKTIAGKTASPLPAASLTACELTVVYSTASGAITGTAPAYDAGWATEIALDVQWAHATAPLARLVLIEAPSASYDNLLGGVRLANTLGPGVVSMSFGGAESSGTSAADAVFSGANMSYLAATGDSGVGVSWPSVSARVLAVGGTSLTYSGTGKRAEVTWSGTGGGVSPYVATPAYQNNKVPGMGTPGRRTVADVAFNADPASGQYVAVIVNGSSTVRWTSMGGTSLATPQWAGLVAVANAMRALNGKPALGAPHSVLYNQIATVPGTYAGVFADIVKGAHGSCAACGAKTGYDQASGLGSPNADALLGTLSGLTVLTAPVVTPGAFSGKTGLPLSFTVAVTAPNAVTYGLAGAPAGMSINGAGVVNWAAPVAGTYAITVTATDGKTGLAGQGVCTVTVVAAATVVPTIKPVVKAGPLINATPIIGVVGRPLSGNIGISGSNAGAISVSIRGAPIGAMFAASGMSISLYWAAPKAGSYQLEVVATDAKGLSAKAIVPVTVTAR